MVEVLAESLALPALVVAAFAATYWLTLTLLTPFQTPAARLARYARAAGRRTNPGADVEELSLGERVLQPLGRALVELMARRTPSRVYRQVAADLTMAGLRISPTVFLTVRLVLMFGIPALALSYVLGSGAADPTGWIGLVLALFWGRKLPSMWLKRRIRSRQRAIDRGLPYSLDLMVACLEGGLSLDAALVKVVEQSEGPLAIEFRKTLQELALGRPTAEAIRDMGERTGAPDLKRLCEDIVQAERMGISIAGSLRTLARESRIQRRQHAEELARKAPIKMVPVLIFCVLPALGIVTTAPAAILLLRTFSQTSGGAPVP
jgi:tight adherence protein C